MICDCDPPAQSYVQISRSVANPNREYYACVNPKAKCDFFQWADAPVGGARKQRQAVPAIASSTGNKSQIVFSVAEMILDDGGREMDDTPQSFIVWINIMAPYNTKLTSFFMKSGCRYNERKKLWSVEFSRYNEVIGTLQSDEFFSTHHVVELPRFLLKGLKTFLHKLPPPTARMEPVLSTFMMDTLLPFQLEGLKFVIARKGKAMIADEMVSSNRCDARS